MDARLRFFTGRTSDELAAAGIGPGTRVCVERSKRTMVEIGDYLGCYFMDDRAAVTALLKAARVLRNQRPAGDVYLVFTTNEEVRGAGGSCASRTLPGGLTLALEVGPTEAEYGTTITGGPIIAYSDEACIYDKAVADRLMDIATDLGLSPRAGLLCLPTLSTHGYEVIAREAMPSMTRVLVEFLRHPQQSGAD